MNQSLIAGLTTSTAFLMGSATVRSCHRVFSFLRQSTHYPYRATVSGIAIGALSGSLASALSGSSFTMTAIASSFGGLAAGYFVPHITFNKGHLFSGLICASSSFLLLRGWNGKGNAASSQLLIGWLGILLSCLMEALSNLKSSIDAGNANDRDQVLLMNEVKELKEQLNQLNVIQQFSQNLLAKINTMDNKLVELSTAVQNLSTRQEESFGQHNQNMTSLLTQFQEIKDQQTKTHEVLNLINTHLSKVSVSAAAKTEELSGEEKSSIQSELAEIREVLLGLNTTIESVANANVGNIQVLLEQQMQSFRIIKEDIQESSRPLYEIKQVLCYMTNLQQQANDQLNVLTQVLVEELEKEGLPSSGVSALLSSDSTSLEEEQIFQDAFGSQDIIEKDSDEEGAQGQVYPESSQQAVPFSTVDPNLSQPVEQDDPQSAQEESDQEEVYSSK